MGAKAAPLALSLEYQRERVVAKKVDPMGEKPLCGFDRDHKDPLPMNTLRIDSERDGGDVTVEPLDHHFVKLGEVKVAVRKGRVETKLPAQARPIESLRIVAGEFTTRIDLSLQGYAHADIGGRRRARIARADDLSSGVVTATALLQA